MTLLIDAQQDGRTALHVACRSGQEDMVHMLLDAGASVNVLTKANICFVVLTFLLVCSLSDITDLTVMHCMFMSTLQLVFNVHCAQLRQ